MRNFAPYISIPLIVLTLGAAPLFGDAAPIEKPTPSASVKNAKAFTGKVTRDKVRLRLQPSLDGAVVRELNRDDMLIVTEEVDDFYGVQPPPGTKGYVYRPYILDGVVEGNKVNVRLAPHMDAPIIAQLSGGDRVDGKISSINTKWLEIDPPTWTKFYVSSDFIERVGDTGYLIKQKQREEEASNLLNSTYLLSQTELQKPFVDVDHETITNNFKTVIDKYADFPILAKRAKEYLAKFQDEYINKKIAYLEARTNLASDPYQMRREQAAQSPQERQQKIVSLEQKLQQTDEPASASMLYEQWVKEKFASDVSARMAAWIPIEIALYDEWMEKSGNTSIQQYYDDQKKYGVELRGFLETYDRPIKNKPGEYLLVNRTNRLPIAYLYSTQVNLQNHLGREITVIGSLRPNNNFAYPAYFVLSVQ